MGDRIAQLRKWAAEQRKHYCPHTADFYEETANEIERLRALIDEAQNVASETQPSWKHRCYGIMSALGLDYGEVDWEMPDTRSKSFEAGVKAGLEAAADRVKDIAINDIAIDAAIAVIEDIDPATITNSGE